MSKVLYRSVLRVIGVAIVHNLRVIKEHVGGLAVKSCESLGLGKTPLFLPHSPTVVKERSQVSLVNVIAEHVVVGEARACLAGEKGVTT